VVASEVRRGEERRTLEGAESHKERSRLEAAVQLAVYKKCVHSKAFLH